MDSLRCQHLTLLAAEKSSPERAINSTTISQDVYLSGPSSPREVVQLIPCTQEALHNNDPSRDRQIGASTSTCIDEFLIDPMEDCGNPHGSPDLQPKLDGEPPPDLQDGCTSTRETQVKFIEEDEVDARPRRFLPSVGLHADTAVVQTSAVLKKQNSFNQVAAENSTLTLKDKDCSTLKRGEEKYNGSPGTDWYETQNAELHVAETGQHGDWDYGPRFLTGSLQNIQMYDTNPYDSQEISKISAGNQLLCYCEESAQHQRGMCKRFQFETAENRRMSTDCSSWTSKSAVSNEKSTVTPLDMETANVSHSESVATSSNQRVTELSSLSWSALSRLSCSPYITPETYDNQVGRSLQSVGGPIIEGPWPSGMGMHLNSIGSTASANDNVKVEIPQEDFGIQQGNLSSGITNQVSRNPGAYLVSMNLNGYNSIESVMRLDAPLPYPAAENGRENLEKNHDMLLNTCFSYGPPDMQPLKSFEQSQHIDHYVTPYNIKSPSAANADKSDRLTCRSPRKKRKKGQKNEDGCRCNCKRSRCLKLYCECFAGGEYCAGTCACQECLNSVEYEDTVSDARQQIESRNPLAFAPKIIRLARELPEDIGESRHLQPAPEARHKRGCNCKKSLCLKGYCECYQAHVGCSLGCRCEGCMNTFGRKEGCGKTTKMENMTNDRGWEMSPFAGKSEAMDLAASEMGTPFQYHSHISPLTPALQGSNVNYVRQAQFPVKHHPSPDSSASLVPLYHVEPPNSPQPVGNDVLAKEREAHEGLASPDQALGRHNPANVDPHLPRLDRSAGLSSHSDPLTMPSPSSASAASQTRDSKAMQPKFIQGSWQESVGPAFRWHNSPVTPPQHFGESRFVSEPDSDDKRHHWR